MPTNPELTGPKDDIINAIFDRILRDERKWQIVEAAERGHRRDMEPSFDMQAYADSMGLTIVRKLA